MFSKCLWRGFRSHFWTTSRFMPKQLDYSLSISIARSAENKSAVPKCPTIRLWVRDSYRVSDSWRPRSPSQLLNDRNRERTIREIAETVYMVTSSKWRRCFRLLESCCYGPFSSLAFLFHFQFRACAHWQRMNAFLNILYCLNSNGGR